MLDDGADYIIFGCTGMLGCADAVRDGLLRDGLDVPVIDPVPVTVNVAAALVRSRLAHSKRAYPEPPKKNVVGYADIGIGAEDNLHDRLLDVRAPRRLGATWFGSKQWLIKNVASRRETRHSPD